MARDIFDPARYTNCSVKCITNNTKNIMDNESGRLQRVLNKVTQFDPTSKYVAKGKELIKISNKIYDSKIIPRSFADGITGVVDTFAVKPFLDITDRVNPEMAGQTKRQLEIVSDSLRAGNLKFKDVEKIAGQLSTLTKYAQNIFSKDGSVPTSLSPDCVCDDVINPAKYIADLYFPKHSSWFCVEFEFNTHLAANNGTEQLPLFAFLCLKTTRPNVKFEIEEVMKYGHKMFVQKRSEYETLDLSFIDDDQHNTHTNVETLLRTLIPNMNLSSDSNSTFDTIHPPALRDVLRFTQKEDEFDQFLDSQGLSGFVPYIQSRASSMNELFADNKGHTLKAIHIYQVFRWGQYVCRTTYVNPVISGCKWSDLETTGEITSTVDMSFRYSSMTFDTLQMNNEISRKLKDVSIPTEDQNMVFDKTNGSNFGQPVQLGPDVDRVKKYLMNINKTNNKSFGFLDKLKKASKDWIKEAGKKLLKGLLDFNLGKGVTLRGIGKFIGGGISGAIDGKIFGTSIGEQFEAGKDIVGGFLTLESTSLEKNKKLVDHVIDGINTAKNKIIDFANSAKLSENMLKNEIPVPSMPVSANNTNTLNKTTFITGYQNKKATTEVDETGGVL